MQAPPNPPPNTAESELVMLSALEHWSYCPRQCALIHLESVWDENIFTLKGQQGHARADQARIRRSDEDIRIEHALPLYSDTLGLVGRADVVEFHPGSTIVPVEYKHGPRRANRHDDLQLCAQALCLEEMFQTEVSRGAIYSLATRRRREVPFTEELRDETRAAIIATRELLCRDVRVGGDLALPPALNDGRCRHCSLLDACVPATVVAARAAYHERALFVF